MHGPNDGGISSGMVRRYVGKEFKRTTMAERPILKLPEKQAARAREIIDAKLAGSREITAPPPESEDPLPAGSLGALLGLNGSYDVHGRFVPHKGVRPKVGEPKVRGVYWCKFTDTVFPEFGKERPVVIVSLHNKPGTYSLVVPISTSDQDESQEDECSVRLAECPNPNKDTPSWAIASHVYAVSHWRLRRFWHKDEQRLVVPRIDHADYERIMAILMGRFAMRERDGSRGQVATPKTGVDGSQAGEYTSRAT